MHLVADSLNPTGIKWLQPLKQNKVKWIIRTGTKDEEIIFIVFVL